MQKLKTILIVCLLSFTTLAQNDSTYCFTKSQVKVFLTTKAELNNCNEQYNAIKQQNNAITDTLTVLRLDYAKEQNKVVRNRNIAIGGISGFIASLFLLFVIK